MASVLVLNYWNFASDQKRKLAELEPFAESIREALKLSSGENGVRYLGNPINCYLMIKRYTSGWKELPPRLEVDEASLNKVQRTLDENKMFMPSGEISDSVSFGWVQYVPMCSIVPTCYQHRLCWSQCPNGISHYKMYIGLGIISWKLALTLPIVGTQPDGILVWHPDALGKAYCIFVRSPI